MVLNKHLLNKYMNELVNQKVGEKIRLEGVNQDHVLGVSTKEGK